jgi:hypothetical protein
MTAIGVKPRWGRRIPVPLVWLGGGEWYCFPKFSGRIFFHYITFVVL